MSLTNYVSYRDAVTGKHRIGHYNTDQSIQPLSFLSGTHISNLYQVIEAGSSAITSSGSPFPASEVQILPPLPDRDVLCVGKNYAEHAKEFNSSGFDSSDKADQPSHPVIFTKRFTSIIADGEEILPHAGFTETVDYEGEIGVIIGKAGFRIREEDAMEHVWGYTIINDVTARERQRDHKQFYIGKSADTFCPMGPVAVPAENLDKVLRVQTRVNGELRQDATTDDLIFSIPYLIKTMSEGQTLVPGDVLATGTPAGVGLGLKPPVYLKPGDEIAVSVTGLGTLTNRIADSNSSNPIAHKMKKASNFALSNAPRLPSLLTTINNKQFYYKKLGTGNGPHIVFIHGIGATNHYFEPLIQTAKLGSSHTCHLWDLEGQGISPTHPLSTISVSSCTSDLNGIFEHAQIAEDAIVVGHGMGCLIALSFALAHPDKVSRLILLGPPAHPLPEETAKQWRDRSDVARTRGIEAVLDDEAARADASKISEATPPLTLAAIRMMQSGLDSEGYAKACTAFAETVRGQSVDIAGVRAKTLILVGERDDSSSPKVGEEYARIMGKANEVKLVELRGVHHWHVLEDPDGVARAVKEFLD